MPDVKLLPMLIERLLDLTNEGKIDWTETASETTFQATVGQYVVEIARASNPDNWDAWDYSIRVADRYGKLIDEAIDKSFDRNLPIGNHTPYEALMLLYNGARRKAVKADEALSNLLSTLESIK